MTLPLRAVLYLRVSTARQAEYNVSITDQKRPSEAYRQIHCYQLPENHVGLAASATSDRRPEFHRMIEGGRSKSAPFDVIIAHSLSRFFLDHFELEFCVRRLEKNGITLVAITHETGTLPRQDKWRPVLFVVACRRR